MVERLKFENLSELLLFESGGDMFLEMQDAELLRAYGVDGDERAFAEVVGRYVDFVYSTTLRRLDGDSGLAEEAAQTVFLLLARKASRLAGHPTLAGWLYRTANLVAAKAKRSETRRHAREREAVQMNANDPNASDTEQILPLLDHALEALSESDRLVVLLRFFLHKPMREVGLAIGVSEAAAKMRVSRAVDRLREFFLKRGIGCTTGALALMLAEKSMSAAPPSLSARIMSRLPAMCSSVATDFGLTQFLILMSKAKAKSLLIAALAGAAVFTIGVEYLSTNPRSNRTSIDPLAVGKSVSPALMPRRAVPAGQAV